MKRIVNIFYNVNIQFYVFIAFCFISFSSSLQAQADLSIIKSVSNNTPSVGEVIVFSITVRNDGPDLATGVRVQDIVASGYGDITNISNGGASIGNNINWNGLIIPANSSLILTLTVTVLPTGEYNNRVQITASDQVDPDSVPANNAPLSGFDDDDLLDGIVDDDESNLVIVEPKISDLELSKEVDDLEPNNGTEVVFTITVTNNGPFTASNVSVKDQLPQGFIWISDDSFGDYIPSTGIWTIGDISNGSSETLNVTAIVSLIDEYTNTAEIISSDSFDLDSEVNNNDPGEDDQDSVTLTPIGLIIPEGFSPNNDGINETFEIPGFGFLYPNFKMEIFNRYGNRVYNYSNEGRSQPLWWNGFSDGRLTVGSKNSLPTGTYYYILYFNQDNIEPLTNWIYLNR